MHNDWNVSIQAHCVSWTINVGTRVLENSHRDTSFRDVPSPRPLFYEQCTTYPGWSEGRHHRELKLKENQRGTNVLCYSYFGFFLLWISNKSSFVVARHFTGSVSQVTHRYFPIQWSWFTCRYGQYCRSIGIREMVLLGLKCSTWRETSPTRDGTDKQSLSLWIRLTACPMSAASSANRPGIIWASTSSTHPLTLLTSWAECRVCRQF